MDSNPFFFRGTPDCIMLTAFMFTKSNGVESMAVEWGGIALSVYPQFSIPSSAEERRDTLRAGITISHTVR